MSRTVSFKSVTCVVPSTGTIVPRSVVASLIKNATLHAITDEAIVGTGVGAWLIDGDDPNKVVADILGSVSAGAEMASEHYGGEDQLYLTLNGNFIWPQGGGKWMHTPQGATWPLDFSISSDALVELRLWEYDEFSSDDDLGKVSVPADAKPGHYNLLLTRETEGSTYLVCYTVV